MFSLGSQQMSRVVQAQPSTTTLIPARLRLVLTVRLALVWQEGSMLVWLHRSLARIQSTAATHLHPMVRVASKSLSLQVRLSFIVCCEHDLISLLSVVACGCLVSVIIRTMAMRQRRRSKASKSASMGASDVSALLRIFAAKSCIFHSRTSFSRTATNSSGYYFHGTKQPRQQ
jgi:hypothetical protein